MNEGALPAGWELWNDEALGPIVLVFRPDVFDGDRYPDECLPTIYVSRARDPRQPPRFHGTSAWQVELRLEPTVPLSTRRVTDREEAREAAIELATSFTGGELDYRAAYQVPREEYLAALDTLIEAEDSPDTDSTEREA